MRLQKYLNETTILTEEEVERILDIGFNRYEDWLSRSRFTFWPLVWLHLNYAFKDFNIYFNYPWFKAKESLGFTVIKSGNVNITLEKGDLKLLKTISGIEKFRKKHRVTFYHELVHKKQYSKFSKEFKKKGAIKKYASLSSDTILEYLSRDTEIEAFARQAVAELKNKGRLDVLDMYYEYVRGSNTKAWRKFLKKLYFYLRDIEGYLTRAVKDRLVSYDKEGYMDEYLLHDEEELKKYK